MSAAGDGATAAPESVEVWVPSEYHRLETVVMCLANPWTTKDVGFDLPLVRQMLRNDMGRYDYVKVREQQRAFALLLGTYGVTVIWATPLGAPVSQHYTRDPSFAIDDTVYVARPRRAARRAEIPGLREVLPRMSKVAWLDAGTIEGGDVIVDTDHVIVGLGEETDLAGVDALKYRLGHTGRSVVVLELTRGGAIHTDTLFNVVGPGLGIVHRPSFTQPSLRWLDAHYDLIEIDEAQRRGLSANTFSIDPKTVVIRDDPRLAAALQAKGVTVIVQEYSEVMRLPGSYRCTTMPVRRTP